MNAASIVRVVGAGAMGRGIAQTAATAGYHVELTDADPRAVAAALDSITCELDRAVQRGRMRASAATAALERIDSRAKPTSPNARVSLVIEAIVEEMAAKVALLKQLETATPHALLATNTSALSIAGLASGLRRSDNLVGIHFFNPVPRMKVAEVVPSSFSAPGAVKLAIEFVRRLGHEPLVVRDSPGFMINFLGRGLLTEALAILAESAASVSEVDEIARDVLGLRMGPFELMDLTGLDISHSVMENVWQGHYADPRLRPSTVAAARVTAGVLGRKTGAGFYAYPRDNKPRHDEPRLRSGRDTAGAAGVEFRLNECAPACYTVLSGIRNVDTATSETIHLVTPVGEPTYRAAQKADLPVERTLGIDPLSVEAGKRLAVSVPLTMSPATAASARQALESAGLPVTMSPDGPAPVAQRLLAAIVNIASTIAESGSSLPADIDRGARLGLGYPSGPLELADRHGPASVLRILDGLFDYTHDPRYRATAWLRARAELGVPCSI